MKQYCRYCQNAVLYGDDVFVCVADAPCGSNAAGAEYSASKAKRPNKCPFFEFNENDVFGMDENGDFRTYKPRDKYCTRDYEQMKMEIPQ